MQREANRNKGTFGKFIPQMALAGTVLACLALLLPIILYSFSSPFQGKGPFTLFFVAISIERFWFSLFTSKEKNSLKVSEDWTFVAVGFAYTLMMCGVIVEFYVYSHKAGLISLSVAGFIFFSVSLALRYWAVKTLGNQWAIHVEGNNSAGRSLIRSGPYKFVRHPIYLAAMLEVVGISLFFSTYLTLLFSCLICIPLQIKRTYYEEKNSVRIFGEKYFKYKESTWAYWPIRKKQ